MKLPKFLIALNSKKSLNYFLFFLVFCGFSAPVFAQIKSSNDNLNHLEKVFVLPGDTLIQLQKYFIYSNSDLLFTKKQELQRDKDYKIDWRLGKVSLIYQPDFPETLYVQYQAAPLNLKPSYQYLPFVLWKKDISDSLENLSKMSQSQSGLTDKFDDSKLRKNGSITRSITVGNNQGLRLNSGLRLQLEGNITSDVEVIASLSDQNTPIQPEGNTQSLQEIDKVYIRIQSPVLQATLGDFNVNYQSGRFGNYQRKLQGAQLAISQNGYQGSVSGAVSKGKFHTIQFKGEEGKQGPYQLRGERGETEIIVLAGTERVWIDGEVMTRGEENDYVIEYGSGQVTFTRNRLVTSDSRIEIDFEYSDLRFQRNLYSARFAGTSFNNRLNFSASLIREADDQNNPLEAEISDEEKQILSHIGDNIDSAFVQSGNFVGAGKGSYIQVDTLNTTIYRYVGSNLGEYQVRFSYVGDLAGDYRYIGSGRYRYEGKGKGGYSPKRNLPIAQSQNSATFFAGLNPINSLQFSGEIALSQMDQNLWSSNDDQDNIGGAFQLRANFSPDTLQVKNTNLGKVQLSGLWRRQGSRFFEITRNREVEYNRKWDISDAVDRGEEVQEFFGDYSPLKGMKLVTNFGKIKKGVLFQSNRKLGEFHLTRKKMPEIYYREEFVEKDDSQIQIRGDWVRRLGTVQYQIWRFRPSFRYEYEDKQDRNFSDSLRTGFAFDDISAGLTFQVFKPLQFSFESNSRKDKNVVDQKLRDNSEASSQKFGIRLTKWKNLQLDFTYTNRIRRFKSDQSDEKKTILADFNLRYSPLRQALRTDLRMQMTTTQISKTDEFYFKVEQGRGTYRFDPEYNEYVPDPFGEYILRTLATGEFEPVNDVLLNGKLSFKPRLIWQRAKNKRNQFQKVLSNLGWETYFSMNEKSKRDNPWDLNFNFSGLFFPDTGTVFGRYTIRQDLFFFEDIRNRSLRYRWSETYEKNNRLTEGGQYFLRQEQSVRYTMRVNSQFSLQTNIYQKRIDRIFKSPGRVNRFILSRGGDSRLSYRPKSTVELAAEVTFQKDVDQFLSPKTKTLLVSTKPSFSYAFRGRGRLRGELEFSNVSTEPENRIIPYEMANGRRIGENFRWQLGLDYRLSSKLMILVSYLGRKDPTREEVQHLGKAEVKAFF